MATQEPVKHFQEFLSRIIDFMALHAGASIDTSDTPATIGWKVVWTDPVTDVGCSELFSLSRDEIGNLVEAIPDDKTLFRDLPAVRRNIYRQYTRTSNGRWKIGQSLIQPALVWRSHYQSKGTIPPNTPREEELIKARVSPPNQPR